MNRNIAYDVCEQRRWIGGESRSISVLTLDWDGNEVNISVLGTNDERVSIKTSSKGLVVERAALSAVKLLVEADG